MVLVSEVGAVSVAITIKHVIIWLRSHPLHHNIYYKACICFLFCIHGPLTMVKQKPDIHLHSIYCCKTHMIILPGQFQPLFDKVEITMSLHLVVQPHMATTVVITKLMEAWLFQSCEQWLKQPWNWHSNKLDFFIRSVIHIVQCM